MSSIQFRCSLCGESIRPHRLRTQSLRGPPPWIPIISPGCFTCVLTNDCKLGFPVKLRWSDSQSLRKHYLYVSQKNTLRARKLRRTHTSTLSQWSPTHTILGRLHYIAWWTTQWPLVINSAFNSPLLLEVLEILSILAFRPCISLSGE